MTLKCSICGCQTDSHGFCHRCIRSATKPEPTRCEFNPPGAAQCALTMGHLGAHSPWGDGTGIREQLYGRPDPEPLDEFLARLIRESDAAWSER